MSARELLRVGFVLLGTFLVVVALQSLVESLGQRPALLLSPEQSVPELLRWIIVLAAGSLAASLVFGVLPGALLIARSRQWAERLTPGSAGALSASPATLLPVGLMLLGLLLGIRGLAGIVGGIVSQVAAHSASSDPTQSGFAWQLLSSSLVQFLCGAALFVWGRRTVPSAA
jgi:hypothetical protein